MEASLIKIGNSRGLIIPRRILSKLGSVKKFNIEEKEGRLIIMPVQEDKPRKDWDELFACAVKKRHKPDRPFLEDLPNEFDSTEWVW